VRFSKSPSLSDLVFFSRLKLIVFQLGCFVLSRLSSITPLPPHSSAKTSRVSSICKYRSMKYGIVIVMLLGA